MWKKFYSIYENFFSPKYNEERVYVENWIRFAKWKFIFLRLFQNSLHFLNCPFETIRIITTPFLEFIETVLFSSLFMKMKYSFAKKKNLFSNICPVDWIHRTMKNFSICRDEFFIFHPLKILETLRHLEIITNFWISKSLMQLHLFIWSQYSIIIG